MILEATSLYSNNSALYSILICAKRHFEALNTKNLLGVDWKHQKDSLGASVSVMDLSGVTSDGQMTARKSGIFEKIRDILLNNTAKF